MSSSVRSRFTFASCRVREKGFWRHAVVGKVGGEFISPRLGPRLEDDVADDK
mgnify:CR=1 FL=1